MKVHLFQSDLWLPRTPEDVFDFFSDAQNLQSITPGWLNFKIISPTPIQMRVGATIDYRLRIHGLPCRWRTIITHWDPPHGFVDEQQHGPYRLWRHEHHFRPDRDGTLCSDTVRYAVLGGEWVNRLFVRRDVERIFHHRAQMLQSLLGGRAPGFGDSP